MRCLIVDDDASLRSLMERLLARAGIRFAAAPDLQAADDALREGQIDIVLLDLELPGIHGGGAVTHVRSLSPRSRVLVVSGHDDPRHVLAALDAGADGYLLKDELASGLKDALQAIFAGHAPLSPRAAAVLLRRMRTSTKTSGHALARLPRPAKVV